MPLHAEARSLGKAPFCVWASVPHPPNGKNCSFPSCRGVVAVVHQRPLGVWVLWGREPHEHPI